MKILRKLVVASMFSVLALSSCKEDEDPAPTPTVTANAGADQTIQSGETVTLDGSGSKDSEGAVLTYQWTIVKKPLNSQPTLSSNSVANPLFSTDVLGVYELELTVSNEHGTKKDNVVITVEYNPILLSNITTATILEDRIVDPEIADYWVNEEVAVDAELTVRPGVVIAFGQDATMYINEAGSLVAKGENTKRIRFTGKANQKGYWRGILVYSNSNTNALENADILNAGSITLISEVKTAIAVTEGARLSVKNCKIDGSAGYGIYFMDGALITGFQANIISNNHEAPLLLVANHIAKLDAASSLSSGNGRNVVEVENSFLTGNSEVTWPAFNDQTPYRFVGTVTAQTGLKLTPGITIEVASENYFEIGDGYINAVGTPEKKITITGVDKTTSSWNGIVIYSRHNLNVMEHVVVSYAGDQIMMSGLKAAIFVSHAGRLTVKNCTISHSGGYGIFINGSDVSINADVETANTFTANALAPVHYEL